MATSMQRVFGTTELLESILLAEPMRSVFIHQRVAKSWQQTVEGSQQLLRKMFLLPDGELLRPVRKAPESNYLLLEYESRLIKINPAIDIYVWGIQQDPIKHRKFNHRPPATILMDPQENIIEFTAQVLPANPLEYAKGATTPTASWRKMLLTRPAITAISFVPREEAWTDDWPTHEEQMTIFNPRGVTLGQLWDMMALVKQEFKLYAQNGTVLWDQFAPWEDGNYSLDFRFTFKEDDDEKDDLRDLVTNCFGEEAPDGFGGMCKCQSKLWREELEQPSIEYFEFFLSLCQKKDEENGG